MACRTLGLTGGSGMLGQRILEKYKDQYRFVVPTSRISCSDLVQHENIQYISSDYSLTSYLKVFGECDAVIHAGAAVSGSGSDDDISRYLANLSSADAVFEACKRLNITNVVNISSAAVYSGESNLLLKEDSVCVPRNKYGIIKLAIEKLAEKYNRDAGMKIKSLRVCMVADRYEHGRQTLFSSYLQSCLKQKPLCVWGDGRGSNEYIYSLDVVKAIICAVEKPELFGSFNIGTGRSTSVRELAELFHEVFEMNEAIEYAPDKPTAPMRSYMNTEKAERELGFVPDYDLRGALGDIRSYYTQQEKSKCSC